MAIELDELAGPSGGEESRRLARFWLDQINSVKDNSQMKHWFKRGETIVKRYRDERNRTDEEGQRRYNALWSNVEVLKPALYGKTPLPVAERRFKDKDPTGRAAAQILERALRNEIEICGFTEALQQAVSDYLLPGRGTVWVRYEPVIEESVSLPPATQTDMTDALGELPGRYTPPAEQEQTTITPGGRIRPRLMNNENVAQDPDLEQPESDESEEKLESTGDRIIRESTPVDFIEWTDFFTFPVRARSWVEVTAIAKRVYMSRDQAKKRFGPTIGKALPLEKDTRGDRIQNTMLQAADEDKCQVFEIWSKDDETVYWVAMGYDYLCDRKDDPLTLENFYPAPRPIYANATTNTLIPVPDFIQYQDQAIQVDELTQRIAMLTKACKMAGVYNAAAKDIQRLFNESIENELIPVDDWAAFAEKGGVEGNWSLMPVQVIKDVINELMVVKQKQIEEMDRLTGINDIMRGTSDPRETLGGVRLKQNNTGTRLTQRQNEVARFARDTVRIMADIMSQHFSPQSLIEVSGALYEEGLGVEDMPPLSSMQPPLLQSLPGQAPPPTGIASPSGAPPAPGPLGQQPPPVPPMPQQASGAPPGGNVIPFRAPSAPILPPGMAPNGAAPLTGTLLPPLPPEMVAKMQALQRIAKAIALLRNERLRGFRVDIEVDSTIFADAAQEKADRTAFITQVTQFMGQSMQLGMQMPEIIPLLGKLLLFGVRGFRIGRDLEMAIEEFVEAAPAAAQKKMAMEAQKPNPLLIKAQTDAQKTKAQIQGIAMKTQSEQASAQAEVQRQQLQNQGEQATAQAELQSHIVENQGDQADVQADIASRRMDLEMRLIDKRMEEMKMRNEMARMAYERKMDEEKFDHEQEMMKLQEKAAKAKAAPSGRS
jgi:hypothetical protein